VMAMWTCPSCGAPNEPGKIFCSQCASLKVKPPSRGGRSPGQDESPVSPLPRFQGNVGSFCLWWIGGTLAGELLGLAASSTLERFETLSQGEGLRARIAVTIVFSIFGLGEGMAQALVLRYQVFFRSGIGWAGAALAGSLVNGVVYLMALEWMGLSGTGQFLASLLSGALGAATAGVLQARLLRRHFGPPAWTLGWTVISAGAELLGTIAIFPLWYPHLLAGRLPSWNWIFPYGSTLASTAIVAAGTGLALGRWLRRRTSTPAADAA
jgi:hypothetical protein